MFRPFHQRRLGWSTLDRNPRSCVAWLAVFPLLVGCAAPAPTVTKPPEFVRSHIYPLPLDNVFAQATTLMQKKGWTVKRGGNVLLTNWQAGDSGLVSYRIFGQAIDSGLCAIRVERLVATSSTSFNLDHPVTVGENTLVQITPFQINPEFAADPLNDGAAGTAPPARAFSPEDLARPSPWVVTAHKRDAELELELQREIDPTPVVTPDPDPPSAPHGLDAGDDGRELGSAPAPAPASSPRVERGAPPPDLTSPAVERRLEDLAGIWDGTFSFKGSVVGSFSGEVTVAVDGHSVEFEDFCPANGGTVTATGANTSAAWEGMLSCSAIPVKGCPAAALTYNFAHAMMNGSTLTVVAGGSVESTAGCGLSSGALSVVFVAQRADYVHIAVTRIKRPTSCRWPSDWEDLSSAGSMSMPEPPQDESAYLGIIRAKGSRLTEIQNLLRHCHQVVLLNGEAVLMKLAATHPRRDGLR